MFKINLKEWEGLVWALDTGSSVYKKNVFIDSYL